MSQKTIAVSLDQARWYRLRRSGLVTPFASAEAAASALVGAQAQILSSAGLALWNRTAGFSEAQFEDLLYTRRTLVKLWGQRNTLHLYPSDEWPLVTGMLANTQSWWGRTAARQEQYDEYSALVEEAAALLRARRVLGRGDLRGSGLPIDDEHLSGWGGIFVDLVRRGHACHAGRAENEGLFAAREHWLPDLPWAPPDVDEANTVVLRRYLHTYGPSTLQDFAYWRGVQGGAGRTWWATLSDELVEVTVNGTRQFILRADLDDLLVPEAEMNWPVTMLYRFDPLLLAHKDKGWIVPPAHYSQVWRPAGHIEGVVLAGGRAHATWRYERKSSGLAITVFPFGRPSQKLQSKLETRARRVAAYFGLSLIQFEVRSKESGH